MTVLAIVPSASVALVVTRSVTHGVKNGAAVSAGIVLGDLVFVALAVLGMSAFAQTFGALFSIFKYIGGAYLIWIGFGLLRTRPMLHVQPISTKPTSLLASFAAGFLLTLGDLKAILFYASLFPSFVDLASIGIAEFTIISVVTIVTVGGVKLAYAFAAQGILMRMKTHRSQKYAQTAAGSAMVGAGAYLITKG